MLKIFFATFTPASVPGCFIFKKQLSRVAVVQYNLVLNSLRCLHLPAALPAPGDVIVYQNPWVQNYMGMWISRKKKNPAICITGFSFYIYLFLYLFCLRLGKKLPVFCFSRYTFGCAIVRHCTTEAYAAAALVFFHKASCARA